MRTTDTVMVGHHELPTLKLSTHIFNVQKCYCGRYRISVEHTHIYIHEGNYPNTVITSKPV